MRYLLTTPGRHEARALTKACARCGCATSPAVVLDREDGTREAGYGCRCGARWVSLYGRP